jgi:hypothetical protein
MPKKSIERAREDEREGKAPSTQAGEFVRDRSFQSAARGGEAAVEEERNPFRRDARKSETRPRKSAGRRPANVAKTFTSHAQGAQARRPRRRVETSTLEARPLGRSRQERCRTLRRREKGRSNSREAISRAYWAIYCAVIGVRVRYQNRAWRLVSCAEKIAVLGNAERRSRIADHPLLAPSRRGFGRTLARPKIIVPDEHSLSAGIE